MTRESQNWDGAYVNVSPFLAESLHLAILLIRATNGNMSFRVDNFIIKYTIYVVTVKHNY